MPAKEKAKAEAEAGWPFAIGENALVQSCLAVPLSHFGTPGTAGTSDHTVGTIGPIDTTRPSLWTFGFVPWDLGFGIWTFLGIYSFGIWNLP